MSPRAWTGVAAVLALAAAGCANVAKSEGFPDRNEAIGDLPEGVGLWCGVPMDNDDRCADCMAGSCCQAAQECAEDAACVGVYACLARCGSGADRAPCRAACLREADVHGPMPALSTCLASECTQECGPCGVTPRLLEAGCADCASGMGPACEALTSCESDPACATAVLCRAACDDPGCFERCEAPPAGQEEALQAILSASHSCAEACGLHGAFECGRTWDVPAGDPTGSVRHRIVLRSAVNRAPLADVAVKACAPLDPPCGAPLAEGATGPDGAVDLDLPLAAGDGRFTGHLRFEPAGDEAIPVLFYPAVPIFRDSERAVLLIDRASMAALVEAAAGAPPDPELAMVAANVVDCRTTPAAGVAVALDPPAPVGPLYQDGDTFGPGDATVDGGYAGFFEVAVPEATTPTVTVQVTEPGAPDATVASRMVQVRGGWITIVGLAPPSR